MWTDSNLLRELLAVVHRDGGHYVADHGVQKATEDAIDKIMALRSETHEIDQLTRDLNYYKTTASLWERRYETAKSYIKHLLMKDTQ